MRGSLTGHWIVNGIESGKRVTEELILYEDGNSLTGLNLAGGPAAVLFEFHGKSDVTSISLLQRVAKIPATGGRGRGASVLHYTVCEWCGTIISKEPELGTDSEGTLEISNGRCEY
jgi:hypothetical protein